MKRNRLVILLLFLVILLSACQPTPQPTTITPSETPTSLPTLESPQPTATFTIVTATPAPVVMLSGEIAFETFSLRTGPGVLFPRVNIYWSGTKIRVLGREAGNNWLLVQVPDDQRAGWMKAVGLTIEGDITSLPIFQVDNAQIVHGHVFLTDGSPATGIVISIAPNVNQLSESSDSSETNEAGEWYLYLPTDIQGAYIVGPNAFTCEGSNAVIASEGGCTLMGNLPTAVEIALPYTGSSIDFSIIPLP